MSKDDKDTITPREAAHIMGIHQRSVQRLLKRGELPGFRAGFHWRIRRAELEAYIARQSNQARRDEE
jgi:excisionase family DNA binding protein